MPSLHQFVYEKETTYKYGCNGATPEVQITDAPGDSDFSRGGLAHGDDIYGYFCFKGNTADTIYQFSYDFETGAYKWNGNELKLTGAPEDVDASQFDVLHAGNNWRFHFKRLGGTASECQLYQFVHNGEVLQYEEQSIKVTQFPADSDRSRWFMYHDGSNYVYGCGLLGTNKSFYSGAWNGEAYQFGHQSRPELLLEDMPEDCPKNNPSMLHDGSAYRFYYVNGKW